MYIIELTKRLSLLVAALMVAGILAGGCSTSDDSGDDNNGGEGTTDTGRGRTDTGSNTGSDAGTSDTGGTPTLDTGLADTGTPPEGCDGIPTNALHGNACSDEATSQACADAGGVCASADPEATAICSQICVPTQCETVCTGADVCIPLADSAQTPDVDESQYGVCGTVPEGSVGPYGQCGEGFGNCSGSPDSIACMVENEGDTVGMCFPTCSGPTDTSCPAVEGFQGQCALSSTSGGNYCAIICQTAGGAGECPTGMTCNAVEGGAMCAY